MSMPTGGVQGLKGTGYQQVNVPRLSPEQQQLFQQLLGSTQEGLRGGLGNLNQMAAGNAESFKNLEAPAFRDFSQALGQASSRFSGMGSGARHSSGFQNVTGGLAADLSERLSAQRSALQQSALEQLLGLSQNLLQTNQYNSYLQPKKQPWWHSLLGGGLPLGGAALGGLFGGLPGAALGSQAGASLGSAFSGGF